jgi:Domain of unknown function (DUF4214)
MAMVKKLSVSSGFSALTNEHLGIIVRTLAGRQPLQSGPTKVSEKFMNKANADQAIPASSAVEDDMYVLDVSGGEIAGRAILIANEAKVKVEQYWVFRTARREEDIERNNYQLVRKLTNALETHLFVDACYQVFLARPADSDGLANYVRMLKSKHLSPRDFMKTLLTSPEGKNHVDTLVIVPYPSPQLQRRTPLGMHS